MVLGILAFVILFIAVVPPYKRGFYCDDHTIKFPFKPNTISVPVLMLLCHGLPSLIVAVYEYLLHKHECKETERSFKRLFKVITAINVEFTSGLYIELILMYVIKSTFGVLRPHFLDVCRPDFETIDCTINDGYVSEFQCTAEDSPQLKYARESFPSGHASSCTYAFCFLLFYIFNRRKRLQKYYDTMSFTLLILYALWAVFVLITRVTDNWHHPTDVYGGMVLGVCVAVVLYSRKNSALWKNFNVTV